MSLDERLNPSNDTYRLRTYREKINELARLSLQIEAEDLDLNRRKALAIKKSEVHASKDIKTEEEKLFVRQLVRLVTASGSVYFLGSNIPVALSFGGAFFIITTFGATLALAGAVSLTVYSFILLTSSDRSADSRKKTLNDASFVSDLTSGPSSFATNAMGSAMRDGTAKSTLLAIGEVSDLGLSLMDGLKSAVDGDRAFKQFFQSVDYLASNYDLISKDRSGKSLAVAGEHLSIAHPQKDLLPNGASTSTSPGKVAPSPASPTTPPPAAPPPPAPPPPASPPTAPPPAAPPPAAPPPVVSPPVAPPPKSPDVDQSVRETHQRAYDERTEQEREESRRWVRDAVDSTIPFSTLGISPEYPTSFDAPQNDPSEDQLNGQDEGGAPILDSLS